MQHEKDAWHNELKKYSKNSFAIAFVMDGYNVWNAVRHQIWEFAGDIETFFSEGPPQGLDVPPVKHIILRPDSGDGVITMPQLAKLVGEALEELLSTEAKKQSYPKLAALHANYVRTSADASMSATLQIPPAARSHGFGFVILQGDSVSLDTLPMYLTSIKQNGFDTNMFRFGSGGGLLQKVDRDTYKFAFKCSALIIPEPRAGVPGETWSVKIREIQKRPIGDTGKMSKPGVLEVRRTEKDFVVVQVSADGQRKLIDKTGEANLPFQDAQDYKVSKKVFENGYIVGEQQTLSKVRKAAEQHLKSAAGEFKWKNLPKALDEDFASWATIPVLNVLGAGRQVMKKEAYFHVVGEAGMKKVYESVKKGSMWWVKENVGNASV